VLDLREQPQRVLAVEGLLVLVQLLDHDPNAPLVCAPVVSRSVHDLWRHLERRPQKRIRLVGQDLAHSEVNQAYLALVVYQGVFGLQVPMDDVERVDLPQRHHELRGLETALIDAEIRFPAFPQHKLDVLHRAAVDKLEEQLLAQVVFLGLYQLLHEGVLQLHENVFLVQQIVHLFLLPDQRFGHHLQPLDVFRELVDDHEHGSERALADDAHHYQVRQLHPRLLQMRPLLELL